MTRAEKAKNYFESGYNCSQSVVLAFREELGVPEEVLLRLSIGVGAGMGRLREVCGTVTAGAMCFGLLFPERNKSEIYKLVQELARRFEAENGSYICARLLSGAGLKVDKSPEAEARTPEYYKKRPCARLAGDVARIVEEICKEEGRL